MNIVRTSLSGLITAAVVVLGFARLACAQEEGGIRPPPPEPYKHHGQLNALENLGQAKFEWLKTKISEEEAQKKKLQRQLPEANDPDAIRKDIVALDKAIQDDTKTREDLLKKDALDPATPGAKKLAQIVKANVQAWIGQLNAMAASENKDAQDPAKTEGERKAAQKAATDHAKEAGELSSDLDEAEKDPKTGPLLK